MALSSIIDKSLFFLSLFSNKDEINEWIKNGFRVAIYIDDSFKYDDISNEWLTIFDYIITNGEYDYDFDRDKIISIGK